MTDKIRGQVTLLCMCLGSTDHFPVFTGMKIMETHYEGAVGKQSRLTYKLYPDICQEELSMSSHRAEILNWNIQTKTKLNSVA
jgi:hypothetical protein